MANAYNCSLNNYKWSSSSDNFELALVLDNSDEKEFYIALFINGDDTAAFTKDFDDLEAASKAFNQVVAAAKA
ncbi:hypothetical protein [Enterobacter sp. DE0047]|uniref:hypothetical protein n=1 Tax=Enterobacter sp. DE0047 TaxID=2584949 RepID=UPI00119FB3A8|nr:hypothetical protein [Enterobacter sp. DE0047]